MIYFHIGLHKTASTLFQKKIWVNNKFINLINKYENDKIFLEIFLNQNDNNLKNFIESNLVSNLPNLVCEENLSGENLSNYNFFKNIDKIYRIFPNSKIIIFLREQKSMINSIYFDYIVNGGNLKFNEFLKKYESKLISKLSYSSQINYIFEKFGKNNSLVLLYEMINLNRNHLILKLSEFLSINFDDDFYSLFNLKVNKQISKIFLKLICVLNKHYYSPIFIRILRKIDSILKINKPKSYEINEDMIKIFRKDNLTLNNLISSDLKKYRYEL